MNIAKVLRCQENYLSVCVVGWFNLCTLITLCATGVQPHPAPESNQTQPGDQGPQRTRALGPMTYSP
ncbi:unnamed protein product [Boreogadus saida]